MRPRKPDGTSWSPGDSNAVLQHIGREITRETNIRDIARGCPDDGNGNAAACELRGNMYVVNPHWARLKTPGSHWISEIRRRWAEFCSEPRDPEVELRKIGETPEPLPAGTGNASALGPAIQAAIAAGIEAGLRAAGLNNGRAHAPRGSDSPSATERRQRAKSAESEPATAETT